MNVKQTAALMAILMLAAGRNFAADTHQPKLKSGQLGQAANVHVFGDIYFSGQPGAADFAAAKAAGVKTVVNLRPANELDFDEASAVRDLGMEYQNIPFAAPRSLNDKVFDNVRKTLSNKKKRGVLLHCRSANRVGAVWIPYRVLDCGVALKKAIEEAHQIGLKTPEYERRAAIYVNKHAKKEQGDQSAATVSPLKSHEFDQIVLNSDGPVLVDFYASWCGPCQQVAPILEKLASEFHGDVKFVKVDVDDAYDLTEKYGVVGIPTMVLFRNGAIVDRIEGVTSARDLRLRLDNATASAETANVNFAGAL